jgi:hypothetical protein
MDFREIGFKEVDWIQQGQNIFNGGLVWKWSYTFDFYSIGLT